MRLINSIKEKSDYSSATYLLWETNEKNLVESSILYLHGRNIPWVICLPTSVGCQLGCLICAMPEKKFPIPLETNQLLEIFKYSKEQINANKFQVSFMGQGEPFLNTKNVFGFCNNLFRNFPQVTIGISTVGIGKGIKALSNEPWAKCVKLQISLHCWPSEKRRQIVPAEIKYPVQAAISEAIHFAIKWNKRCSLNCVLVEGINDSIEDAQNIAQIAQKGPFYVKVSQFNEHGRCNLKSTSEEQTIKYCDAINTNGVEIYRFKSIGTTIGAGCGQTKLSKQETVVSLY